MSPYAMEQNGLEDSGQAIPAHASRTQPDECEAHAKAGTRVVICEDEALTQLQLRRILTHAQFVIAGTAADGEEAVRTVLREQPDLVLMDIQMPRLSGLEAARHILGTYPVCMVMLTAHAEESYRQQAEEMGASGYIVKPIMGDALLPALHQALETFACGRMLRDEAEAGGAASKQEHQRRRSITTPESKTNSGYDSF